MKKTIFSTFLICLFMMACQTNTEELNQELETSVEVETKDLTTSEVSANRTVDTTAELAGKLQWTAYIAAKVMVNNVAAKNEVSALMDANNSVSLDLILGSNSQTAIFSHDFIDELSYYILQNRTELDEGRPPRGLGGSCCGQGDSLLNLRVSEFIEYVVDNNCLELYFPNGLVSNFGLIKINSTGHPLTTADSNFGYERFNGSDADLTVVKANSYRTMGTIVVARPENDSKCGYNHIPVSDFTLFLPQWLGGLQID